MVGRARLLPRSRTIDSVKHDLLGTIFSGSGLVWYGGAIGGAIGVIAWMRWRGVLELRMFDMCATALALGYAIGRIGCQVSGDGDYGIRSNLPWAMGYPHGTVPTPPGVRVQPTPIYETLAMCLLAYALWRLRDRVRPGVVFALYLRAAAAWSASWWSSCAATTRSSRGSPRRSWRASALILDRPGRGSALVLAAAGRGAAPATA